jgi:uncharacterized protein YbbK (DUF523 family)
VTKERGHLSMIRIVVSACLLGSPVRHDGRDKKCNHPIIQRWMEEGRIISVCPEMLGGLPTPRPPAEIVEGERPLRVVARDGGEVTAAFEGGARAAADAAASFGARVAILKEGSPSCGSSFVYDGSFSSTKVAGEGVAAALLRKRGIAVFSEEQLDAAQEYVAELEATGLAEA